MSLLKKITGKVDEFYTDTLGNLVAVKRQRQENYAGCPYGRNRFGRDLY